MENKIVDNISIIVAIADNHAIGRDNQLLWHLSDDLKRFRRITTGHTVIMGRNTFLSLPKGALPDRKNIVITDRPGETFPGCFMAYSIAEALEISRSDDECFIIGGGMIYSQFMPLASRLYLTRVHETFEADTFFPEIDLNQWEMLESEPGVVGEKNRYPHTFIIYKRRIV